VPVRLVLGHLEQTTTILGLESDTALRRVIDRRSRVVSPPEHGILLTKALAEQLDARNGSVLTIEILEGDRRVAKAPMAGTVDELVGTSAYMELGALHRLVRGEQQVNGAFLRIAESRRAEVRRKLAALPAVSGVAERSAVLASFERTVQDSFRISLTTVLGFAILIASGIVYNSGRIALSERSRELASLRVLGFSRREVAVMLLGEQLALVVCAIPLGWLCGYGLCALVNRRAQSETFRLPLSVSTETFATATIVVLVALAFTAATLRRRVDRLDPSKR
jgi:putative ABC transport system permease protein